MKCSQCKNDSATLITFIDPKNRETKYICDSCLLAMSLMMNNIDDLDVEMKEIEVNMNKLAAIIDSGKEPGLSGFDKDLASIIFTPSKVLQLYLKHYKNLVSDKQRILSSMDKHDKLFYDLKKAIEEKNYERVAKLRDEISKTNKS